MIEMANLLQEFNPEAVYEDRLMDHQAEKREYTKGMKDYMNFYSRNCMYIDYYGYLTTYWRVLYLKVFKYDEVCSVFGILVTCYTPRLNKMIAPGWYLYLTYW